MTVSHSYETYNTLEELRTRLKVFPENITSSKPLAEIVAGDFETVTCSNLLYTWHIIYTGSKEHALKQWMRVGLEDNKWIQLFPGAAKIHPWFDEQKNILVGQMADDAAFYFDVDVAILEDVGKWADEVSVEYVQQKIQETA